MYNVPQATDAPVRESRGQHAGRFMSLFIDSFSCCAWVKSVFSKREEKNKNDIKSQCMNKHVENLNKSIFPPLSFGLSAAYHTKSFNSGSLSSLK